MGLQPYTDLNRRTRLNLFSPTLPASRSRFTSLVKLSSIYCLTQKTLLSPAAAGAASRVCSMSMAGSRLILTSRMLSRLLHTSR